MSYGNSLRTWNYCFDNCFLYLNVSFYTIGNSHKNTLAFPSIAVLLPFADLIEYRQQKCREKLLQGPSPRSRAET